ncbi:hypothetical protein AAFX24_28305 [Vibrio mediterranei]|uniref:hypothetical protein n=1 Tax=Vibrio mediterranei TaxID=689 RepID=UPI0038CE74CC
MESKGKRLEKPPTDLTRFFVFWITAQAFHAVYFFESDKQIDTNFLDLCAGLFVGMTVTTVLSFVLFILYKSTRN